MRIKFGNISLYLVGAIGMGLAACQPSAAADLGIVARAGAVMGSCAEVVLSCEDGRQYPLCPIAVSLSGDIVTANLHTGRGVSHVRLVPMGVGYRYAGRGIWVDGLRENAVINFGKHSSVACIVTP